VEGAAVYAMEVLQPIVAFNRKNRLVYRFRSGGGTTGKTNHIQEFHTLVKLLFLLNVTSIAECRYGGLFEDAVDAL